MILTYVYACLLGVREALNAPCVGNLSVSKIQRGLQFSLVLIVPFPLF